MSTGNLTSYASRLGKTLVAKSPAILTGVGAVGMVVSTVLAVKATPKALALIDIHHKREEDGFEEPLTKTETVKLTWKCYIPSAIMAFASIACLIGANTVNGKQKAALATMYALSETTLHTYKNKVVEMVGEEKAKDVQKAVTQEKITANPVKDKEVIITGKGEHLCYEPLSNRYFKGTRESILQDVNDINRDMQTARYITINDWLSQLDLPPMDRSIGETCGWHIDDYLIDITFSGCVADDGTPCLGLEYLTAPKPLKQY